jgi:hypothetical protein
MKTPIQEVYENFNLMSDADFKAWMLNTDLLEKEKEVICEFAKCCTSNGSMHDIDYIYNEIFKTKER